MVLHSILSKERLSIQKRSKNVIKGLRVSTSVNEVITASGVVYEHLRMCMDITNTRCLGKPEPVHYYYRNLLVTLRDSKEVDLFL